MSLVVSEPTLAQILPENDQLVSLLVLADASRRVAKIVLTALENAAAECFTASRTHEFGDAENAGLENAGLQNVGPNRRSGKGRTGKRGNIVCMGSEM